MIIRYPILCALIVTAIWGTNVIAVKTAVNEVGPTLSTILRFVILIVLLVPFAKIPLKLVKPILSLSLLMGIGHFYLLSVGLEYLDSNTAVIIVLLGAPISSLIAYLQGMEQLRRPQVLGISLAFFGAIIPTLFNHALNVTQGAFLILLSMTVWAWCGVRIRQLNTQQRFSPLTLQFWTSLAAFVATLAIYLYQGEPRFPGQDFWQIIGAQSSWQLALAIFFMTIVSSIISYWLWYRIIADHGINKVVNMTFAQPIFTAMAAYFLLQETPNWTHVLGASLTLAGLIIYYQKSRQAQTTQPAVNQVE